MTVPRQAQIARTRTAGWLWALGVGTCVALVLAGAYAGRHLATARTHAAAYVAPPSIPYPAVMREVRPEAGAAFAVPIGTSSRMVLVASSAERSCPPVGVCGPVPPLDQIEVVDIGTGSTLVAHALTGSAQQTQAVTVDPQLGLVALLTPSQVVTFDAATLEPVATFALPAGASSGPSSGAVVGAGGTLWLTTNLAGQPVLLELDERTGDMLANVSLSSSQLVDGPVYDAQQGAVLVMERAAGGTKLAVFSAANGTFERHFAVPAGARLGPLDAATGLLYLFGADGTTYLIDPQGSATGASPVPGLFGARALGWDAPGGQRYVADAAGLRVLDERTGATFTALPVAIETSPEQPLLAVDVNGDAELPVLGEHGTLLVLRPATARAPLTADSAALLARAALTKLVPQDAGNATPQDPLFLTATTFTPGPGSIASVPFMVKDPDVGWQSATPGTAGISVAPSAAGAYDVTFTITWTQHQFTHRHVAVLRVAPNDSVTLVSDSGDAMP